MSILLDTNAYLRLAKHFRGLLGDSYVTPPNRLQVISDVDSEISNSPRLASKFYWAFEQEYSNNRTQNLVQLSGNQPTQIMFAKSAIEGISNQIKQSGIYQKNRLSPPSPTDCLVLAYSSALSIEVVSDDGGMQYLADHSGITLIGSHVLLKKMLDIGKITIADVQAVARFLKYNEDFPASWGRDAKSLFGIALP